MLNLAVKIRHWESNSRAQGVVGEIEVRIVKMEENTKEKGVVEEPVDFIKSSQDSRESTWVCETDN